MNNVHDITKEFEKRLSEYTGAPYVVTVDNQSNALFLTLFYEKNISKNIKTTTITIPKRTYMSVPCEIINAGLKVKFSKNYSNLNEEKGTLSGAYELHGSNIWDSALSFTTNMYKKGTHMCISFTGPYKHLKLGKGGAILTDNEDAYKWFKKARFSGRSECSYHDDHFDMLGHNYYLYPEFSAKGLLLINQFYNLDGTPKHNEDLELPYPDLSKFPIYSQPQQFFNRNEIINAIIEYEGEKSEDKIQEWLNRK